MARPKKGHELGAIHGIALRVSSELRDALVKQAEKAGTSISTEARKAIEAHVGWKTGPEPPAAPVQKSAKEDRAPAPSRSHPGSKPIKYEFD